MAMNIISKEKKEIRWLGLPTNSVQECTSLEKEKQTKLEQIQKKTLQLQELILQVCYMIMHLASEIYVKIMLISWNFNEIKKIITSLYGGVH